MEASSTLSNISCLDTDKYRFARITMSTGAEQEEHARAIQLLPLQCYIFVSVMAC